MASDKQNYTPGESARLRIEPPFAGEALVAIATDRIVATYPVQVPAGGTTFEVPIKAEWGAGAYALVTAWRPLSAPGRPDADPRHRRGMARHRSGPAHPRHRRSRAPEKVTPRQRIEVPIKVANLQNEEAYVTLAAVDEGILQLTRFKLPNPADYYFGKRKLGVAMRDDYGRLLDANVDDLGRIRTGGDSGDIGGLDVVPTRTVALFSGPVKLDDKGEAKIALDIPDFIGQLRLMTVAYDKTQASARPRHACSCAMRSPPTSFCRASWRPRIAAAWRCRCTMSTARPATIAVTLEATGAVALDRPVAETRKLAANQRELLTWDLKAGDAGFGKVAVAVEGPGNFAVRREWDIQVRSAQTPTAIDTVSQLDPQRELMVDRNLTASFAPGTSQVSVALSRIPGIDVPGLLRALGQVPVRLHRADDQPRAAPCSTTTTWRCWVTGRPIRAFRIACRMPSIASSTCSCPMVRSACGGPMRRRRSGCRAMRSTSCCAPATNRWRCPPPRCSAASPGSTAMSRRCRPTRRPMAGTCWPRAASPIPDAIRYFQDTKASDIEGGLAWAQLAAALNHVAEPGRARLAFALARQHIDQRDPHEYYGSPLRNRAALIALATEAGGREALTEVVNAVREKLVAKIDQTTTQEEAWLLLAARAMSAGGELAYSVDGDKRKAATEPVVLNPDQAAVARGMHVTNDGERPVWLQVTARGVPLDAAARRLGGAERPAAVPDARPASPPISRGCARTTG